MNLKTPVSNHDHTIGPADAPVTLVEYADYECPYCGGRSRSSRTYAAAERRLRFVFRNFPLTESTSTPSTRPKWLRRRPLSGSSGRCTTGCSAISRRWMMTRCSRARARSAWMWSGCDGSWRRNASRPRAQGLLDWHGAASTALLRSTSTESARRRLRPATLLAAIEQAGLPKQHLGRKAVQSRSQRGPPLVGNNSGAVAVALTRSRIQSRRRRARAGRRRSGTPPLVAPRSALSSVASEEVLAKLERDARGSQIAGQTARRLRRDHSGCAQHRVMVTEVDSVCQPTGTTSVSCPSRTR